MKKISFFLLALIIGLWQTGLAQSGIYITASGGWANQSKMPKTIQNKPVDIKHFPAVRLGVGYLHDINGIFGIGLEVARGWYRGTKYHLDAKQIKTFSSTYEFLAIFALHYSAIDYSIKIGGNRHTLNNFSVIVNDKKADETKIQPVVAAGINYNFNTHFALTAEYLHSFGSKIDNFADNSLRCPSINAVLVGVRVSFW